MNNFLSDEYAGLKAARDEILSLGYYFWKERGVWVDKDGNVVHRPVMDNIIDTIAKKHLGHSLNYRDTFDY